MMGDSLPLGQPRVPQLSHAPVSNKSPTAADEVSSTKLVQYLDVVAPLSSAADTEKRKSVLAALQDCVSSWVRTYYSNKLGLPAEEAAAPDLQPRLYVSGSYRLGVSTPGSDIDALVVAPAPVERADFFESLPEALRSHPSVQRAHPIPNIKVPIIEVQMGGIEIDLLFAQLATPTIPKDFDLLNDEILKGVDPQTARSLNGPRVNELIIKHLVPANWETFKVCLRAVRHWFRVRGLYSNKLGFLGGVNFAILVTAVAQWLPRAAPCSMVQAFFRMFSTWEWRDNPLYVCEPYNSEIGLEQWGEKPTDNSQYMKIITPAYPVSNSSFNVTKFTLEVMEQELKEACKVTDDILSKDPEEQDWARLFQPSDFFTRYDKYLGIRVSAFSKEDHTQLSGYVESQIRHLMNFFELMPLKGASPWHKGLSETKNFGIDDGEGEEEGADGNGSLERKSDGSPDAAPGKEEGKEGNQGDIAPVPHAVKEETANGSSGSHGGITVKSEPGVKAEPSHGKDTTETSKPAANGDAGTKVSADTAEKPADTGPQVKVQQGSTPAGETGSEEKSLEVVEYVTTFFVGLEVDRSYVKRGMSLNLQPAVEDFLGIVAEHTPADAEVSAQIIPWAAIPDQLFPQGREAAKQEWKKARRERRRSAAGDADSVRESLSKQAEKEVSENVIPGLSVKGEQDGAVPGLPGDGPNSVAGVAAGVNDNDSSDAAAGGGAEDTTTKKIRGDIEAKSAKVAWPELENAPRKRMRVLLAH